jgi:ActR/RegA family two-component response regulator
MSIFRYEGAIALSTNILLVTTMDETFRKPLLESQGYRVEAVPAEAAEAALRNDHFQLALLSTEAGAEETLDLSARLRQINPHMRVAVLAHRAEYVPTTDSIAVIIREQHSPGRFLAVVKKLLDGEAISSAADGDGE